MSLPNCEITNVTPRMWMRKNLLAHYQRIRDTKEKELVDPCFCVGCRSMQERASFSSYVRGDKRYWHTRCNPCRSRHYLDGSACRKKKRLLLQARNVPCRDCGGRFHPVVNHFVIRKGCPAFHVEQSWTGRSVPAIKEELKKYDVVCSNCFEMRRHNAKPERWLHHSRLADLPPELQEVAGLSSPSSERT